MSTARLNALPRRRERHFGDRDLWCFADRPASTFAAFAAAVRAHPDRPALIFGETTWTYAALDAEVARLAAGLAGAGVGAGTAVGLLLGNRPEFVTLLLALQRLGAIAVPMDVRLQGAEVGHALADSGAHLLLHEAELADRLPDVLAAAPSVATLAVGAAPLFADARAKDASPPATPGEEDCAFILYTSGTTGRPKGAVITHLNIAHSAIHHAGNLGLTPEDRSLIAVPLSHVTGIICGIVAPLFTGGATILLPRFKAREFLEAASRWRMTYTIMVPAMYNLCLRLPDFDDFDLSAWRLGHFGASPMPPETLAILARKLPDLVLVSGYGATETCSPAVMSPVGEGPQPRTAAGRPLPCVELRIVDPETGREVPTGEAGELWIKGPMVVPGYWRNEAATEAGFVDGYWRSGDIGRIDAAGNVEVHDRLKDVINRGGYKIYSAEVEAVLLELPEVVEAATVARADPVLGERVHAFVSVSAPIGEEALARHCAARLADYKVPESWTVGTDPLPRNSMGKLAKKELRAFLANQPEGLTL